MTRPKDKHGQPSTYIHNEPRFRVGQDAGEGEFPGCDDDGCYYCGRCECGDAEDRRKRMAAEIRRLRERVARKIEDVKELVDERRRLRARVEELERAANDMLEAAKAQRKALYSPLELEAALRRTEKPCESES